MGVKLVCFLCVRSQCLCRSTFDARDVLSVCNSDGFHAFDPEFGVAAPIVSGDPRRGVKESPDTVSGSPDVASGDDLAGRQLLFNLSTGIAYNNRTQ